ATNALPVGDRRLERGQLEVGPMHVVIDDVAAEGGAGDLALGEQVFSRAHRMWNMWVVALVSAAFGRRLELQLRVQAMQAGGDHGGDSEMRVHVGARQPVLDMNALAVSDDAHRAGP